MNRDFYPEHDEDDVPFWPDEMVREARHQARMYELDLYSQRAEYEYDAFVTGMQDFNRDPS